eukprot:TRINITY_DN4721_c0_g1_i1.p1 TRINITY_DN4721_c0_g1~~TRINITY_DN4721_c0_g1_i1.p1  ORF type:complete len:494 (-),score=71.61 TRINITY_DN4721_c0_g1_i1:224-1672(-)
MPGRSEEKSLLASLLTSPGPIPPLFIYGAKGTGKTSLVLSILRSPSQGHSDANSLSSSSNHSIPHVYVNCIEIYSERILFEIVLSRLLSLRRDAKILSAVEPTPELESRLQRDPMKSEDEGSDSNRRKRFKSEPNTTSTLQSSSGFSSTHSSTHTPLIHSTVRSNNFVSLLLTLTSKQSTTFLVFDKAEKLRELGLIPLILSIPVLTNERIGVILISNRVWDHFRCQVGIDPICVFIPPLSFDDIVNQFAKYCPKEEDEKFFIDFCTNVLRIFHFGSRDIHLLQSLVFSLYDVFVAPIKEGKVKREETSKLYKHLEPHLKNALLKLNFRDVQTVDHQGLRRSDDGASDPLPGMPKSAKYILLAAYLASVNHPKFDDILYNSYSTARKRKTTTATKAKPIKEMQSFSIDRLRMIFLSITPEHFSPKYSVNVIAVIRTLVSLNLLVDLKTDVGNLKMISNVSHERIRHLADNLSFALHNYLVDT